MPNRILRESILDSESVNSLTNGAELFYRRLMSVVDDFGRFDARPAVLRSRLYPLQLSRVREADVVRWIAECERANLIRVYAVNSSQYLTFHKLGEPRAKESKYPSPADCGEKPHESPDARTCAQTRADVPYSDSYSDSLPKANTNTNKSPPTPRGGGRIRKRIPKELPPIPPALDTPEFREVWAEWLEYRRERREAVTPRSAAGAFAKLSEWGPAGAVRSIRESIANGWKGVFPPPVVRAGGAASRDRFMGLIEAGQGDT